MIRRRRIENEVGSGSLWLLTFSDLLILMLTFFVMRLSMSTIDINQQPGLVSEVRNYIVGTLNKDGDEKDPGRYQHVFESPLSIALQDSLSASFGSPSRINKMQGHLIFPDGTEIQIHDDDSMSIVTRGLFEPETANLTFRGEEFLAATTLALLDKQFSISISAYAGDKLPRNRESLSNWDLSREQARAALRQMIDRGVSPNVISAAGYAYSPVQNPASKTDENTRLQIIIRNH